VRALLLLGSAVPDASREALARIPIGVRDGALLELRERVFGPELMAVADCPWCGAQVEFSVRTDAVRSVGSRVSNGDVANTTVDSLDEVRASLVVGAYELAFRLPTTADVAELASGAGVESGAGALLDRCVLAASADGVACSPAELPDDVVAALERRMDDLDPNADIRLTLCCPDCGEEWRSPFTITEFLWADVDAWAWQTLGQVHALASAYGWREADVLALSPARRALYLGMVQG
jgi:hypothetical protein